MGSQANINQIGQLLCWILLHKKKKRKKISYIVHGSMEGRTDTQVSTDSNWNYNPEESSESIVQTWKTKDLWAVKIGNKVPQHSFEIGRTGISLIWQTVWHAYAFLLCLRAHTLCLFLWQCLLLSYQITLTFQIFKMLLNKHFPALHIL